MRLSDYIWDEERPIIYLDQTSFRGDIPSPRTWFFKKHRFIVPTPFGTVNGFTVYGAVGPSIKGKGFYYEIHESTNSDAFEEFIVNLANQVEALPNGVKPVLILDNHRS